MSDSVYGPPEGFGWPWMRPQYVCLFCGAHVEARLVDVHRSVCLATRYVVFAAHGDGEQT